MAQKRLLASTVSRLIETYSAWTDRLSLGTQYGFGLRLPYTSSACRRGKEHCLTEDEAISWSSTGVTTLR